MVLLRVVTLFEGWGVVGVLRVLIVVLAAIVLSSCSGGVPAREALSGEALAWESVEGAEIVAEAVIDGSSGGLMGKPSFPKVTRHLAPVGEATPQQLLDQLIADSVEQGWEDTGSSADLYRATKSLAAGEGQLLISIHTEYQPARVILTRSSP